MAKEKTYCPTCGACTDENPHKVSSTMVHALCKFAKKGTGQWHYRREIDLTHEEACNLQKLKHFGIVDHGDKAGYWKITPFGWSFLAGRVQVPHEVRTYRGKLVWQSTKMITIREIDDGVWLREDYAKNAVPHNKPLTLF